MYRERAPTAAYAALFAVIGGVLLSLGQWVGGAVLVVFALACAWANYADKDDSSGLY
jgi:hypothetical protein